MRGACVTRSFMCLSAVCSRSAFWCLSRVRRGRWFPLLRHPVRRAFLQSNSNRFRLRLIAIGLLAVVTIVLAILIILQIPGVGDFFRERARLEQSYDSARLGRFARHWLGMILATQHPLGIGPLEFAPMFGEDTHNIWLKAVLDYGWIGFIAFLTLTFLTLGIGFKLLFRNRPWQPFLLVAYATYLDMF